MAAGKEIARPDKLIAAISIQTGVHSSTPNSTAFKLGLWKVTDGTVWRHGVATMF
jgi:hypothetical protein